MQKLNEKVMVRCNVILGMQEKPRKLGCANIETIDLSYILTRYDNKSSKDMKVDLLMHLGYSAAKVSNKIRCA